MNDLLDKIGYLSAGVIWVTKNLDPINNPHYTKIDYLLNGLLTSTLNENSDCKSRLLFADHFHEKIAVFIFQEFKKEEYLSFLELISKDLSNQKHILVIDEENFYTRLLEFTPKDLKSALHLF